MQWSFYEGSLASNMVAVYLGVNLHTVFANVQFEFLSFSQL
jgi:hypothetical protein